MAQKEVVDNVKLLDQIEAIMQPIRLEYVRLKRNLDSIQIKYDNILYEHEEDLDSAVVVNETTEEKIIEDDEFGEVEESEDGEEFDPLKEMMKLVEMEEREGKQFRDHLKALNVDLKELGLEDQEEWGHDEL